MRIEIKKEDMTLEAGELIGADRVCLELKYTNLDVTARLNIDLDLDDVRELHSLLDNVLF